MHTIRKTSTIYTRVIGVCTKKLLCDRITTPIRWNSNEQWQWAEPSRAAGGWRLESLNREIMAETKSRSRCMDMEYMVMDIDDVNALNTCMSPSPSPPTPHIFSQRHKIRSNIIRTNEVFVVPLWCTLIQQCGIFVCVHKCIANGYGERSCCSRYIGMDTHAICCACYFLFSTVYMLLVVVGLVRFSFPGKLSTILCIGINTHVYARIHTNTHMLKDTY